MSGRRRATSGGRRGNELRPLRIRRRFTQAAPGSVLIEMGRTVVLCTASLEAEVPSWRQASGLGWLTAEYSMLPGATSPRRPRSRAGHTDSRGTEIQRLIGRVLRAAVDFTRLGPFTITIDCDVLQADGGTRTAAINGGFVALVDAVRWGRRQGWLKGNPIRAAVAAVSVGLVQGRVVLDLDYAQDSQAEVDLNVAMTDGGDFVEVQGTGEQATFSEAQLRRMLAAGRRGTAQILAAQRRALRSAGR